MAPKEKNLDQEIGQLYGADWFQDLHSLVIDSELTVIIYLGGSALVFPKAPDIHLPTQQFPFDSIKLFFECTAAALTRRAQLKRVERSFHSKFCICFQHCTSSMVAEHLLEELRCVFQVPPRPAVKM